MTPEERAVRKLAREFADGEIRPRSAVWDERRRPDEGIAAAIAEFGFPGMRVPEEFGGLGLDLCACLAATEELARGDAGLALSVAMQSGPVTSLLRARASEDLQRELLPGIASGEFRIAFALGRAEAGDATATPTAVGWRLDGRKRWVVDGGGAAAAAVFARVGPERGTERRVGVFLVDTAGPGYRVARRRETLGLCAAEIVDVELDGVRVDADRTIGRPAPGFECAETALPVSRLGGAAVALGVAQAAFEHAAGYAREREQFGRTLAAFGAIRHKLAGMATRIAAARALVRETARALDAGGAGGVGTASWTGRPGLAATPDMARWAANRAAVSVAREAVQIFGGYGYMRDYPVEKLMRDASGTGICEATGGVLRIVAARGFQAPAAAGRGEAARRAQREVREIRDEGTT